MKKTAGHPPGLAAQPSVRASGQGLGFSQVANSKKGAGPAGQESSAESRAQLVDQYGRIVTPQPLVPTKGPNETRPTQVAQSLGPGGRGQSEADNQMETMSAGGFSETEDEESKTQADEDEARSVMGPEDEERERRGSRVELIPPKTARIKGPVSRRSTVPTERVTEAQLESLVTINLRETETVTLYHAPSVRYLADGPESKTVLADNARYEAAVAMIAKSSSDVFPARGVQTLAPPMKSKDVQANPPPVRSSEAQVNSWDIYDRMKAAAEEGFGSGQATDGDDASAAAKARAKGVAAVVDALVSVSLAAPGCLLDPDQDVQVVPRPKEAAGAKVGKSGAKGGMTSSAALGGSMSASRRSSMSQGSPGKPDRRPSVGGPASPTKAGGVGGLSSGHAHAGNAMSSKGVGTSMDSLSSSRRNSGVWGLDSGSSEAGDPVNPGQAHGHDGKGNVKSVRDTVAAAAAALGGDSTAEGKGDDGPVDILVRQQAEKVLGSHALSEALALVERAVQQNLYHESHRKYRSGPAQDLLERLLEAGGKGGHSAAAAVMRAHTEASAASSSPDARKGPAASKAGLVPGHEDEDEDEDEAAPVSRVSAFEGDPSSESKDHDEEQEEEEGEDGAEGGKNAHSAGAAAVAAGAGDAKPALDMSALAPPAPGMSRLFSYYCPAVRGLNVNCMTWNKRMRDLLAVGYGPYDFAGAESEPAGAATGGDKDGAANAKSGSGLIALWTMANPEQPQAILRTPDGVGVTSLDFSSTMPNVLAAGLYDGTICMWDVARIFTGQSDGSPALVSDKLSSGAHSEAVWQVQWVTKAGDAGHAARSSEVLVSISTDGRVTEWTINKGLQAAPLMTLKRARAAPSDGAPSGAGAGKDAGATGGPNGGKQEGSGNPGDALGATGSEGLLSRTACGLCLDFHPSNPTLYFVGTEDGLLARCSTSYAEQYLEVVAGHTGPINRTRLSPFLPAALLTASSDGTCKLWNTGAGGHAFNKGASISYSVEGATEAVTDVSWSPSVSTRFASVTRDGHVTVWDAAIMSRPALDAAVTIEEEDYRAQLEAKCAEAVAAARRVWADERAKMRASMGDDEPDDPALAAAEEAKDEDLQAALELIKEAYTPRGHTGLSISSGDKDGQATGTAGGKGIEESKGGDDSEPPSRAGTAPGGAKKPARRGGFGMNKYSIPQAAAGPAPKKLSCVLFADNTHVLLTGDSSGRVDVYRLMGLPGADDGSGAPPVGSEAHEEQLEALKSILTTL